MKWLSQWYCTLYFDFRDTYWFRVSAVKDKEGTTRKGNRSQNVLEWLSSCLKVAWQLRPCRAEAAIRDRELNGAWKDTQHPSDAASDTTWHWTTGLHFNSLNKTENTELVKGTAKCKKITTCLKIFTYFRQWHQRADFLLCQLYFQSC